MPVLQQSWIVHVTTSQVSQGDAKQVEWRHASAKFSSNHLTKTFKNVFPKYAPDSAVTFTLNWTCAAVQVNFWMPSTVQYSQSIILLVSEREGCLWSQGQRQHLNLYCQECCHMCFSDGGKLEENKHPGHGWTCARKHYAMPNAVKECM